MDSLHNINKRLDEQTKHMAAIQLNLDKLTFAPKPNSRPNFSIMHQQQSQYQSAIYTLLYITFGLILHSIVSWFLSKKQ